jgi:hypothetical protein
LTAGDEAKIKVFILPVPPTPVESTTHLKLDSKFSTPIPLTQSKAASGLRVLSGRILFSQSSFTTPNDVYVINDLKAIEQAIRAGALLTVEPKIERVTDFWREELRGKNLSEGEEFWFKGAEGKSVQGWTLKPKGWKDGDIKKWPVALLIHGGRNVFQQFLRVLSATDFISTIGPQSAWEDQWSTRWNPNGCGQIRALHIWLIAFSFSFRSSRLLCRIDQPDRKYNLRSRYLIFSKYLPCADIF